MWPALIFACLVVVVLVEVLWRERRLRKQRLEAKQQYTAQLLREREEAYTHAQAQQRALFDSMADGVLLLGADGKIQLVNDSLRKLFGRSAGTEAGRTLQESFGLKALTCLAGRVEREKSVVGVELELPGVPVRHLEINASAIRDREGGYRGAIFVFHDLTRLKQLENTRKEFVANVSHELRTPLSLIHGFVETLLEGALDQPQIVARYLKTIQKHTDRLTYLIEDLLTISQLESGQGMLNLQPVDVRELMLRVIEDLRAKAEERQVQVQIHAPARCAVSADADRLEQVLFNLFENAIKYGSSPGGVIAGAHQAAGSVEIWVRDDGPGIPPESQSRIFERFYRVDRARSRETGGTGLGLAIVKHIVSAHGGRVWVESELGRGSTFHVSLPRADKRMVESMAGEAGETGPKV